jgi:hypothetical protein
METVAGGTPVPQDRVDDAEILYHAVRDGEFNRYSETEVIVSETAYQTPNKRPSVDRAKINNFEPHRSRFNEPSNAVVSLLTEEVRAIDTVFQHTPRGEPAGEPYVFDVIPRPIKDHPKLRDNPAHAQIEPDREISHGTFERLTVALALMSSAELDPHEPVVCLSSTKKTYHRDTCYHVQRAKSFVPFRRAAAQAKACKLCKPEPWATRIVGDG